MTQNEDDIVLKTNGITKSYHNINVIKNINIMIKKGDIYALIGKNGAGKTTLIKLLTGIAKPTRGEIELFNGKVCALMEPVVLFPNCTAYENLKINCLQKGIAGQTAIFDVMAKVGLQDVGKKKFKHYSLGMKQRLGIAKVLLGNPDFLILDEPINGLDPIGIIEIRKLLKELNEKYGITILICSHILKELSMIASKYGIIDKGELIEEITPEELTQKLKATIYIEVNNPEIAKRMIQEKFEGCIGIITSTGFLEIQNYHGSASEINTFLIQSKFSVNQIKIENQNIESYFSERVGM